MRLFLWFLTVCMCFLFRAAGAQPTASVSPATGSIFDLLYAASGKAMFVADDTTLKIFSDNRLSGSLDNGHSGTILSMAVSPDSTQIATAGKDSTIVIWDVAARRPLKIISDATDIVTSVSPFPQWDYIVYGTKNQGAYLYDLKNDRRVSRFETEDGHVPAVKVSGDGTLIAVASGQTITLYDATGNKLSVLKRHTNMIRDVAFNNDQSRLVSCGDDGRVVVWGLDDVSSPFIIEENKSPLTWKLCVDFHPGNNTYVVGDSNGRITIYGTGFVYAGAAGAPVFRVRFKPTHDHYLTIAAATLGKGIVVMPASDMKLR